MTTHTNTGSNGNHAASNTTTNHDNPSLMDGHLTEADLPLFTRLRMTAFGKAVINMANNPEFDDMTFSQRIRYALDCEITAQEERRTQRLLKASQTPHPEACVENIHFLPGRNLNRELIARLASCQWIDNTTNVLIIGKSSVGKTYLALALLNAGCRKGYSARFYRLDDLNNKIMVLGRESAQRLELIEELCNTDVLVLDDFLTTPINSDVASDLLNVLAVREHKGSTIITSQFEPEDWYKTLGDKVVAESILRRLTGHAEIITLDGPDMRRRPTN